MLVLKNSSHPTRKSQDSTPNWLRYLKKNLKNYFLDWLGIKKDAGVTVFHQVVWMFSFWAEGWTPQANVRKCLKNVRKRSTRGSHLSMTRTYLSIVAALGIWLFSLGFSCRSISLVTRNYAAQRHFVWPTNSVWLAHVWKLSMPHWSPAGDYHVFTRKHTGLSSNLL